MRKALFIFLLTILGVANASFAQKFSMHTEDILLNFKKQGQPTVTSLPIITWKTPSAERTSSSSASIVVEALVTSEVELKSVSLNYKNRSVVVGEKSYDVKGQKSKKVKQPLTLNDGQNVVEIIAENINGGKVSSTRTVLTGEGTKAKSDGSQFKDFGKEFTLKNIVVEGDKVSVYYDLADSLGQRTYMIELYSSEDKFASKLTKVSGAIGLDVKAGVNHKLTWNAKEELGADFSGKVQLEVRGRYYVPFIQINPLKNKYKRSKDFSITWNGGTSSTVMNFDLYKGDELIYPFANIANTGQTTIRVPSSVKVGEGYYFRVTDRNDKDMVFKTSSFVIKRKTPMLLKVLPIAIAGGVAATLGGGSKTSGSNNIPDPLSPTTIH